jgi:Uma2 family endonuclease
LVEVAESLLPEVLEAPPEDIFPKVELLETDGEPLESDWHRLEITLLVEAVKYRWRDRSDFYAGGNMFIYFDEEQARKRSFRGPDFFFVQGAKRTPLRRYWVVWQEGGRYPDVIIELLSPKTAREDRTTKKAVYETVFRTPEYFCYDPDTQQLEGWRLGAGLRYAALTPNERGWLWSEQLGLWLGTWTGSFQGDEAVWLRFYDADGQLVWTGFEAEQQRAEAERQRAEDQRQRAEAAEAEVARLKALLAQRGTPPGSTESPTP